jgi:hypothetical protein
MKVHGIRFIVAFLALVLSGVGLHAEVKTLHVDLQQTDTAIEEVH